MQQFLIIERTWLSAHRSYYFSMAVNMQKTQLSPTTPQLRVQDIFLFPGPIYCSTQPLRSVFGSKYFCTIPISYL
jgi:hypothetical protein